MNKKMKVIKHIFFICNIIITLLLSSCDDGIKRVLAEAGDNRGELEKVLAYFNDEQDDLKRSSANFLIRNMPYNYTYSGRFMDVLDSAYMIMSEYPLPKRHDEYKRMTDFIVDDRVMVSDIHSVKADYLIKNINEACDTWKKAPWSKDYPDEIFFDYVLPYRLQDEQVSDWRSLVHDKYPFLLSDNILSKRGLIYEAENAKYNADCLVKAEGASGGKLICLSSKGQNVTFDVSLSRSSYKQLFIRYTASRRSTQVLVSVNGIRQKTLCLHPTQAGYDFTNSREACDLHLNKGHNTVCLSFEGDTVGVDYIQLNALEFYRYYEQKDYSDVYYRIENKKTHNCISIASRYDSIPCVAEALPYKKNDVRQWLRMDYRGYGCWRISAHSDTSSITLETEYCSVKPGSPVGLFKSLNGSNQKWVVLPAGNGYCRLMNKDSGMFLESKRVGCKDTLVQNPYRENDLQKWMIKPCTKRLHIDDTFTRNSAVSEAMRVFDITNQYEWVGYDGTVAPKARSLLMGKTGNCRDEADYTVYICRSLGIPAAVDFTPHWGNRSLSHSWSVLIKPNGTGTPFYMGCAPCDTAHYYHPYKKPKVFRYCYKLNREYAKDLENEKEVPNLFQMPKFTDVTNEYYETTDVVRCVPKKYADKQIAYICVFDNRNWIPVHYGKVEDGKVKFKSMGRNIMYIASFYINNKIIPFGNPFCIDADGTVKDVVLNDNRKQTMTLLRKYPFMGAEDFFNLRMSGGKFQGANKADFTDAATLYTFKGATNGNWYNVPVHDEGRYRYLRYIGPASSHCNINELTFYDENKEKINGIIIGTEGESWAQKEKAFDGDILTGFSAISSDGNWLGLSLSTPCKVSRISFIGRNDGNGIEIGNDYELMCWSNGWKSLEVMKAVDTKLIFKNMPSGGLYVLHNITKGHEERIFTYAHGKQIWW